MHKLLLIGYRGYGDWLYAVPALPSLFEKYEIHLETNFRGWELFHDDPRFKSKSVFDVDALYNAIRLDRSIDEMKIVTERWEAVKKEVKPDITVNLFRSLESKCVAEAYQEEFKAPVEERRKKFGEMDWHEQAFNLFDLPVPEYVDGSGLYYSAERIEWAERWRQKHKDDFIVMIPVAGSGIHKQYTGMENLVNTILAKYDNAVIYLLGSALNKKPWVHKRIYHAFGSVPYKQAVLMAKYADMVIGPETGLHVGAGLWGTPKIQLCTMSNVRQLCQHHKNDYSVQSECECSPCHKMVTHVTQCDRSRIYDYGMQPECSFMFDEGKILTNFNTVYERKHEKAIH